MSVFLISLISQPKLIYALDLCFFLFGTNCFFGVLTILFGSELSPDLMIAFSIISQILSICSFPSLNPFLISSASWLQRNFGTCVCNRFQRLDLYSSQFSFDAMSKFHTSLVVCFSSKAYSLI